MTDNIRDWYQLTYPGDNLGKEIREEVTFAILEFALHKREDVYEVLGEGADAIIRERVFVELAERKGVDYETIYGLWIGGK